MAQIKSGASSDLLTIDPTSKAARATLYDSTGREVSFQSKAAYMANGTFTPAATPTDIVTIFGSATKLVKVTAFLIGTTNTAAGSQQFFLVRRTAVDTTGTFVAATTGQFDTNDPALTATAIGHYTANPGGLGAGVNFFVNRVSSPIAVPASFAGNAFVAHVDLIAQLGSRPLDRAITLRGTTQGLCLNFNGAALVAGQTHYYNIVWTEE